MTSLTHHIYIVSDGTGETAEKVSQATLIQFTQADVEMTTFARVLSTVEIEHIVTKAKQDHAFLVYTLMNQENRDMLRRLCDENGLFSADIVGTLMSKFAAFLGQRPAMTAGLGHPLDEDYFRRVEAIEFTVKNDDGQEPSQLFHADIVLTGLSRTSKTPLSIYLAHKGFKVANVPLVKNLAPPAELFQIDQKIIFGLRIKPEALVKIRRARLRHLGLPADSSYAAPEAVAEEVKWVQEFFSQHTNWPILEVTNRAIEETAADLLKIYEKQMRPAGKAAHLS